jgi:hypothetical protein
VICLPSLVTQVVGQIVVAVDDEGGLLDLSNHCSTTTAAAAAVDGSGLTLRHRLRPLVLVDDGGYDALYGDDLVYRSVLKMLTTFDPDLGQPIPEHRLLYCQCHLDQH